MTFDLAVVGTPFLDLTLTGLERLPAQGEEVLARDLHVSPGGAAVTAVAGARLGMSTALVGAMGEDFAGRELRRLLDAEGVTWVGPSAQRSSVRRAVPVGRR